MSTRIEKIQSITAAITILERHRSDIEFDSRYKKQPEPKDQIALELADAAIAKGKKALADLKLEETLYGESK